MRFKTFSSRRLSIAILAFIFFPVLSWSKDFTRLSLSLEGKRQEIRKVEQEVADSANAPSRIKRLREKLRKLRGEEAYLQDIQMQERVQLQSKLFEMHKERQNIQSALETSRKSHSKDSEKMEPILNLRQEVLLQDIKRIESQLDSTSK